MDLARYILRRALLSAFVVMGVTFLVFVVAQVVPSDPAALYAGPRPNAEQIEKARVTLNLDAPLPERFAAVRGSRFAVRGVDGDRGFRRVLEIAPPDFAGPARLPGAAAGGG